jgi:rhodanese-related sulfurtransferase
VQPWDIREKPHPLQLAIVVLALLAASSLIGAAVGHGQSTVTIFEATLGEANQKTPDVSTDELRRVLADKSAVVFDARPHREYAVSHIPGALNVAAKPGVPISVYVSDVSEVGRLVGGNKAAPIVLYCNGPFCGKSKRLGEELVAAGFTNVRRYQLGIPTWRALVGVTEIGLEGVQYVHEADRTAVFLDARTPEDFKAGTVPGARNLPLGEVKKARRPRTTDGCRWRTTTRASSCSAGTASRLAQWPRPSPRRRSTTWRSSVGPSRPSRPPSVNPRESRVRGGGVGARGWPSVLRYWSSGDGLALNCRHVGPGPQDSRSIPSGEADSGGRSWATRQ